MTSIGNLIIQEDVTEEEIVPRERSCAGPVMPGHFGVTESHRELVGKGLGMWFEGGRRQALWSKEILVNS